MFCCDVPAGGHHREAGEVGAEWGARRRGTCAPLCFVQRATDLSACLSLASRSPPWVWKNRLRCSVHPPFASLPRRSPRGVVGPSASSSRRWNYRAGARLKCSWKSCPGAWRLLQHCHLPARGLLSLISLLRAFPPTGINRNQSVELRSRSPPLNLNISAPVCAIL